MTTQGWIFMVIFWGALIGLNIFCYKHIFEHRHKHGRE
jgi:hypothetical protein